MSRSSCLRWCCLSGLVGSLLFLAGDMLFYGSWSSGADFHPYQQMGQRSTDLLVLGGAIGPVAALFSALGMGVFALTLEPASRKLANTAAILLAIMILIGGSYTPYTRVWDLGRNSLIQPSVKPYSLTLSTFARLSRIQCTRLGSLQPH